MFYFSLLVKVNEYCIELHYFQECQVSCLYRLKNTKVKISDIENDIEIAYQVICRDVNQLEVDHGIGTLLLFT